MTRAVESRAVVWAYLSCVAAPNFEALVGALDSLIDVLDAAIGHGAESLVRGRIEHLFRAKSLHNLIDSALLGQSSLPQRSGSWLSRPIFR